MKQSHEQDNGPYPESAPSSEVTGVVNEIQFALFEMLYGKMHESSKESGEADIANFLEYCKENGYIIREIINKDTGQPPLLEKWRGGEHDVVLEAIRDQIEKMKQH